MRASKLPAILLLLFSSDSIARTNVGNWEACGGRLERALDTLHRDSTRRNRLDEEEANTSYQQELRSAPLEMSVSRIAVKLQQGGRDTGSPWARVEKCMYEPGNNSLQTRVMFSDLSVSGMVLLMPRDHHPPNPAESCRMTLRLRRAGVDFLTSPIARGRGQMRIRTESSFLEPRFASIYAYGCHPTRADKQIKRQDKWPPFYPPQDEYTVVPPAASQDYEAAEPRQLAGVSKEVDVVIPNEARESRYLNAPVVKLGIWRKNVWLTKSSRERRAAGVPGRSEGPWSVVRFPGTVESGQEVAARVSRVPRSTETITPQDFDNALSNSRAKANETVDCRHPESPGANRISLENATEPSSKGSNDSQAKLHAKREDSFQREAPREIRHLYADEHLDNAFPGDLENDGRSWQAKEYVAREMEDVFLRGASQALTRYIEKQLHPAIKETLMISMGYTISYG